MNAWERGVRRQLSDAQEDERLALVECARLRAWLREFAEIAGPDAMGVAERVILGDDLWPAGRDRDELAGPQSHGARRSGGLSG